MNFSETILTAGKTAKEKNEMDISVGANEIIREAQLNPYEEKAIECLIEKHGVAVAAEAICVLARMPLQSTSNVPYLSKR
jgi:hypothetical protein